MDHLQSKVTDLKRENIHKLLPSMKMERMAVAGIHEAELADSGLTSLGIPFLYRFYYGSLLEDPDYFCYIYKVDGAVAGFTSFSLNSRTVCQRAIKRSWPALSWTMAGQIICRPAIFPNMLKMAGSLFTMKHESFAEIPAEGMSTAVAKQYRSLDFFRATGINIGQTLYLTMAKVLYGRGVKQVKGFTRKSNVLVHASLGFLGWKKVSDDFQSRGSADPQCVWVWDLEAAVKKFHLMDQEKTS